MSRNYPDLNTPLGRAWARAAGIHQSLLNTDAGIDPTVRSLLIELAHGQKVLAEYIESLLEGDDHDKRTG